MTSPARPVPNAGPQFSLPSPAEEDGPSAARLPGISGWLEQGLAFRRILLAFRRRLKLFGVVAALVFIAVVIATIQATPRYTAKAQVMLDTRKQQVADVQAVMSGLTPDSGVVDSEVEVLKSRQLAERVVAALRLDRDPEFNSALRAKSPLGSLRSAVTGVWSSKPLQAVDAQAQQRAHERIVDAVLHDLSVKRTGLTYVIEVSFTSSNPAKAADIANAFADKYLTEQLEAKFQATQQANDWLNQHLGELRGQVEQAEAAVQQYKISHNIYSAGASSLTEQEISNYNQQVALAKAQQAQDEAALETAQKQLASGSNGEDVGAALDSPVIQQLRSQRATVSATVADLSGKYGPRHPEMLKAQRQLADIDAQIQAEAKRVISNLQARTQLSRERTASIVASLSGAKGGLAANNEAQVGLNELQRKADSLAALYQSFLNRFQQTSSAPGVDQTDSRVVSRAKIPTGASSPNYMLNYVLGLLLGSAAGAIAVLLAEMFDTGLTTADDVELRLGYPHLGSLPALTTVADDAGTTDPVAYLSTKPLSSFAEAFRGLRTTVRYARVGHQAKVLALTSALPSEGKTTTSVCLGRAAAQSGDRVVIVDCDLRRRNINKLLGVEVTRGLVELLNGQARLDDVLLQDVESGAYILPLAHSSFTPKDVFGSAAMDELLRHLRERFDLVILDTAPALAVADTRVLAAKADAVIFLARWRKTPEKAIQMALKQLASSGGYIAGVALTLVNMKEQARYGYGDPGYYYSEYKKYYAG